MKKKLLFSFTCVCLLAANANAQLTYNTAFALGNNANDQGFSMVADLSGNYYCTGSHAYWMDANPLGTPYYIYNNGGFTTDMYVAKYDPQGILVWAFDIGGSGNDVPLKIILDPGNNVYITGRFEDTVDFDPGIGTAMRMSKGGADIFLAKYDNNGIFQWANAIGDSLGEQAWDVTFDLPLSNVVITGGYASHHMDVDPVGTHVITNNSNPAFNFSNCFVAAYDLAGNYQWAINIGGFGGATGQRVTAENGNIYVGGIVSGDSTDFDPGNGTHWVYSNNLGKIFLAKYNILHSLVWVNSYGGLGGQTANSLAVESNGSIYQGGFFNSDSMDVDPGPGTNYLHNYPNGVQDIYVTKFNTSDGSLNWAFSVGGLYSETAQELVLDYAGHFFITGNFGDTVDFDPGPATHLVYGHQGSDGYLAEYDTAGNFTSVIPFTGDGSQFGIGACIIPPDKVGVTGFFSADSVDFDPGPAVHNLYVNGGNNIWTDAFVAVYTFVPTGINKLQDLHEVHVFPNPAGHSINIAYQDNTPVYEINITDILGQNVYHSGEKSNGNTYHRQIDCSKMNPGIYFLQLKTGKEIQTIKFIKQ